MRCQERDQDLLLFGLGELPFWQRQKTAAHLRGCSRCRRRQVELADVSGQIAAVLRPPAGGSGRGPGLPASPQPGWLGLSPLFVVLVLGVVLFTCATVWYVHSRTPVHRVLADGGCLPGLPSDRCR